MSSSQDARIDIGQLAGDVLAIYDIEPEGLKIIQNKGLKTLWKFSSNRQEFCLKRLRHSKEKALFSVNAQIHILEKGGNVARIFENSFKNPITEHEGQIFILYSWIDGRDFNFGNFSDLCLALEGLAKFHSISKGYRPPEQAEISSKLGRWPKQYESMKNRMLEWKEQSKAKAGQHGYRTYLKYIDSVIEIADMAMTALENSPYEQLTSIEPYQSILCHQDFGEGNALLCGNEVYILDLDGVTYDLPARDLRKIIGKQMDKRGEWRKEGIEKILECYERGNKLSMEEKEVLKVDLLFPHWFFGDIKNMFQKNKPVKEGEIERTVKLELSKVPVLEDLF